MSESPRFPGESKSDAGRFEQKKRHAYDQDLPKPRSWSRPDAEKPLTRKEFEALAAAVKEGDATIGKMIDQLGLNVGSQLDGVRSYVREQDYELDRSVRAEIDRVKSEAGSQLTWLDDRIKTLDDRITRIWTILAQAGYPPKDSSTSVRVPSKQRTPASTDEKPNASDPDAKGPATSLSS